MIALAPDGDVDGAPPRLAALQPDRRGGAPRPRKTAFALGAATHAAVREQLPVIFFSLEMDYLELTQRILAAEAGINSRLLRTGRIPESDWSKISATVGRLAEAPLFIDDNPHLTVMDMRAKCRRLKAQHGDLGSSSSTTSSSCQP